MTNLESLQSYYSDFYKDVHGFRPRGMAIECWNSEEWLQSEIDGLHAYLKGLDATEDGRVQLRCMGFPTADKAADQRYTEEENAYWDAVAREDLAKRFEDEMLAPLTEEELIQLEMDEIERE